MKRFLKDIAAQKKALVNLLLLTAAITGIQIALPGFTKVLIDQCIPDQNLRLAVILLSISIMIIILGILLKKLKIRCLADVSIRFQLDSRNRIFKQYQSIPYANLNQVKFGEYSTNIVQDVESLSDLLFSKIVSSTSDIIFFVSSFGILMWVSPLLTIILYGFILIFTIFIYHLKTVMSRYYEGMAECRSGLNDAVHEILSAQKVIAMNKSLTHFMSEIKEKDHKLLIQILKSNLFGPSIQSSVEIATMVTYLITFGLYRKSDMTFGEVFLFLSYLPQVWVKFSTTMDIFNHVVASKVFIDRIYQSSNGAFEGNDVAHKVTSGEAMSLIHSIEFRNANFSFDAKVAPLLDDFNLHITSPGIYYVIGPSGIGKSTLFDLFLGFYRLESGTLLYNGEEVTSLDEVSLRKQIGLVPQNEYLFDGSVWDNICLGREVEQEEVAEKIKQLGAEEYFDSLPHGLKTQGVSDESLSSGQKKIISILRACCMQPSVLLFDEVTSNLDENSASDIERMISSLSQTCICICITHKEYFHSGLSGETVFQI